MRRLMLSLAAIALAAPAYAQVTPQQNDNYETEDTYTAPGGYYSPDIAPNYSSGSRALSPGIQPTPREQNPDSTPASQSPGGAIELPGTKGMGN